MFHSTERNLKIDCYESSKALWVQFSGIGRSTYCFGSSQLVSNFFHLIYIYICIYKACIAYIKLVSNSWKDCSHARRELVIPCRPAKQTLETPRSTRHCNGEDLQRRYWSGSGVADENASCWMNTFQHQGSVGLDHVLFPLICCSRQTATFFRKQLAAGVRLAFKEMPSVTRCFRQDNSHLSSDMSPFLSPQWHPVTAG